MKELLSKLEALANQHEVVAKRLFQQCEGKLFPADALAISVLNRSLQLKKGFSLLIENGCYTTAVALLRLQLDNVLRLNGVLRTSDPHETANLIYKGTKSSKIKDKSGENLRDNYLVEILTPKNSWLPHVYNLCCSYIHLSEQHIFHLLEQSKKDDRDNERIFAITDGDDHIDIKHKREVIEAFKVATDGVLTVVNIWMDIRAAYGSTEDLKKIYKKF